MDRSEFRLSDWLVKHQTLVQYIEPITIPRDSVRRAVFAVKRTAVHNRMVSQLVELVSSLKAIQASLVDRQTGLSDGPLPAAPSTFYDDPGQNLVVRELSFVRVFRQRLRRRIVSIVLEQITTQIKEAEEFLAFYHKTIKLMPSETGVRINDSFFQIRKDPPQRLAFKLSAAGSWITTREADVAAFPAPPWMSDFRAFFDELVNRAIHRMDLSLSYVEPLIRETEIARMIFCDPGTRHLSDEIDEIVAVGLSGPTDAFVKRAIEFSLRMVPDCESRTAAEQSVGLMIFFRIIFDRFYEKRQQKPLRIVLESQRKLWRLSHLPLRLFNCPVIVKDLSEFDVPIRDYFFNEYFYRCSSLFMNEMIYVSNPVDALYYMHRGILAIHKAALMQRKREDEITPEDLNEILCFDDFFLLLVGVVLASDIPDFFEMAKFIDTFTPQRSLSNSFEYAQAAIGALVLHFNAIDVDELTRRATEEKTDTQPAPAM
jgi:hypothetical protein